MNPYEDMRRLAQRLERLERSPTRMIGYSQWGPDPGFVGSSGSLAHGAHVQFGTEITGVPGGVPIIVKGGWNGKRWIGAGAAGAWYYELVYGASYAAATTIVGVELLPVTASNYLIAISAGPVQRQITLPAGTWNVYPRVRNAAGAPSAMSHIIGATQPVWVSAEHAA